MRKLNQKGFTIIELLVVIVIIGILVALTLPNLFSAQARGRDTDRKNELKNLQTKLETYFNDNDEYPSGTMAEVGTALGITESDEYTGPRTDAYEYECTNEVAEDNCQGYELRATLENDGDKDAVAGVYTLAGVNQE